MTVRIAVVGAGLIGRRHVEEIDACADAELAAVVDPFDAADEVAARYSVPRYATLAELFAAGRPDGVILATPNQLHVDGGLECVAAGVPVIVEKPIGDTVESATRLVEAGEAAGVPVLTGHHRNYSPIMARARETIRSGALGDLVAVNGTALFHKPDDYFTVGGGWRTQPGGGPILLNLIHEVNNLLSLVGDIVRVQAVTSNATRGFAVEDTAAMIFTFAGGALGTFLLSDTAASPRSWEQTSGENTSYDGFADEDCYHITGTRGSLSVPTMRLRVYEGERSWWAPLTSSVVDLDRSDPLANQIAHFAAVIRGEQQPICSGRDGLTTLKVVDAVVEAARTSRPVDVAR
ncbi:Gfo/Idh/MocA family protein [Nakamurella sp.]|uniref:Gfo/Idh/MocA family protein n=1 Tax=Nakamurella sp. TaxID=1869182 RepID=UPI003B3A3FAD